MAINYTATGNRTEFAYDGLGRRVRIIEYGSAMAADIEPKDGGFTEFTTDAIDLPDGNYKITFEGVNPSGGENTALIDLVALNGQMVENGGFETPEVEGDEQAPEESGWSWTGSAGISGTGSALIGDGPSAPQGSQTAFITNNGSVSQMGSVDPGTYTLSFQATQASGNKNTQVVRGTVQAAVTKTFLWSGNTIAEERDSTGAIVKKRFFAEGQVNYPTPSNPVKFFYTRDHLGSIREVTDSTGAVVARYDYDAWGKQVATLGNITSSDFGYTGHYVHGPSEMNLTRTREYNPTLARWMSRDPIGEGGAANLYRYVSNDPVDLWDPLGLKDILIGIAPRWFTPGQLAEYNRVYHDALTVDANAAENNGNAVAILSAIDDFKKNNPLSGDTVDIGLITSKADLASRCKKYDEIILFAHGNTAGPVQGVALGYDRIPTSELPGNCYSVRMHDWSPAILRRRH